MTRGARLRIGVAPEHSHGRLDSFSTVLESRAFRRRDGAIAGRAHSFFYWRALQARDRTEPHRRGARSAAERRYGWNGRRPAQAARIALRNRAVARSMLLEFLPIPLCRQRRARLGC